MKVLTVHMLLLLQHKAVGQDTAYLSLLACSCQPKTETVIFWIRRKLKPWTARKGSDGKWLSWHRIEEHHSSPLPSALLMLAGHVSMEVAWRWEKHTSPKHKRLHASLFFLPVLLQLLRVQLLPSFPAPFLVLPACMESYCQTSVLEV